MFSTIIHSPAFHSAVVGWLAAARVDYKAFRTWKSLNDAKQYDWSVALWNWLEGIVGGAVIGSGINLI